MASNCLYIALTRPGSSSSRLQTVTFPARPSPWRLHCTQPSYLVPTLSAAENTQTTRHRLEPHCNRRSRGCDAPLNSLSLSLRDEC